MHGNKHSPFGTNGDQYLWRIQGGRRGFMSGVAELKAGPTQEQQNHARLLREQLLADLQEQVLVCNGQHDVAQHVALHLSTSSVPGSLKHEL